MDNTFVRNRISELRAKKGVSEYKMSLDLGHSKSYIQSISSGKALPSFSEFLYICEYLGVTPKEFFDADSSEPQLVCKLTELAKRLTPEDLTVLINIAERLADKLARVIPICSTPDSQSRQTSHDVSHGWFLHL